MVGAVIVRNGRVVAEGYHRRAGADHAEVVALKKAGRRASGATVYTTLEPCCHTGRTGPCCRALIEAGVSRVVLASIDPDPRARGRGVRRLRRAGVKVKQGVLRHQAERLNEAYYGYHRNGRPFVTVKLAQTIDGRIATAGGDSQWISSLPSRKLAHRLRAENDAVMIGLGTVRADNPALTVRQVRGRNPYRIVVTGSGRFPRGCRLLTENDDFKTVVATTGDVAERLVRGRKTSRLTCWIVRRDRRGRLSPEDLLEKAARFGLQSLLIEGGAELATSFLKAGLVDKYVAIIAPRIIGGGIEAVRDLGIRRMADSIQLARTSFEKLGPDLVVFGYLPGRG